MEGGEERLGSFAYTRVSGTVVFSIKVSAIQVGLCVEHGSMVGITMQMQYIRPYYYGYLMYSLV